MVTLVLDYLERTAAKFPQKTAFEDLKEAVSFSQLVHQAKSIGSYIAKKVAPKSPVIVYMEKDASNIAAFLGAVYAGCFYVPVDSQMPADRIRLIVGCLQPALLICSHATIARCAEFAGDIPAVLYMEAVSTGIEEKQLGHIRAGMKSTDLLYALFTSGSTGIPKGVAVSHLAVIDFVEWICGQYGFSEGSSFCSQAPFYFDASVPDLYIPLKTGATVYIPPKSYYTFPKKVLQFIQGHQVDTLIWVPSALCNVANCHAFDVCVPTSVKTVIFCGEVMPCRHLNVWKRFIPDALYVNMYGPTEAVYACTYYNIEREFPDDGKLPLGKACGNSQVLLLTDGRQSRQGEIGEICILGQCLASGYYNGWEKTKEAFVQNPLNTQYPELMYQTGDLAYVDENGDLMFAGRKDSQIKRLGHRIELGEVEHAARSAAGIENACCLFDQESNGIVIVYAGEVEERQLDAAMAQKLPNYMKPTRYIHLSCLPMNQNGKVDRVKLKEQYIGGEA